MATSGPNNEIEEIQSTGIQHPFVKKATYCLTRCYDNEGGTTVPLHFLKCNAIDSLVKCRGLLLFVLALFCFRSQSTRDGANTHPGSKRKKTNKPVGILHLRSCLRFLHSFFLFISSFFFG